MLAAPGLCLPPPVGGRAILLHFHSLVQVAGVLNADPVYSSRLFMAASRPVSLTLMITQCESINTQSISDKLTPAPDNLLMQFICFKYLKKYSHQRLNL